MRRCLLLAGLVLGGGCRSLLGIDEASVRDAGIGTEADPVEIDAAIDAPPTMCFGVAPYEVCVETAGLGLLTFAETTIDTSASCPLPYLTSDGADWCVYPASQLIVNGTLRAVGNRPLVLLATTKIDITPSSVVDVSSSSSLRGPAAGGGPCTPSAPGVDDGAGGGGGAGGSFATRGGNGGNGNSGVALGGSTQQGLGAGAKLRGGCKGARGGTGAGAAGVERDGGGAIYLLAGTVMNVEGSIVASGAPGAGGVAPRGGGSGGGSGGMVLLWSPVINVAAGGRISANGAGGGGGGDGNASGNPGSTSTNTTAAFGGIGASAGGGNGGLGNSGGGPGGGGFNGTAGGGGGGGGAGLVRVLAGQIVSNGVISPPLTTP